MQLTQHFNLSEFTRSATASRLGIDNTPPPAAVDNLRTLCEQVLEPLRQHIRSPVIISSGYRCKALNKAVGGVWNSQHITGEAADIQPSPSLIANPSSPSPSLSPSLIKEAAEWIRLNCSFDQLLIEKSGTTSWLHVSCRRDPTQNRHMVRVIEK